ncbi:MAG: carbohydrate ABC transporter permease [Erysipelotrichales bacterium]|nr:carbohydrate ABC transporter permease [Erysipelotrichales bacterium]
MEKLDVEKLERIELANKIFINIIKYAFLILMAIIVIVPFYWMFATALKDDVEILLNPPTLFPRNPVFANFYNSLMHTDERYDFIRFMQNTIIVGVLSTIGTIIITIFAAFAFARMEFKGRNTIFAILLTTMMIPGEMMIITNFMTVARLGWINSEIGVFAAMIVPFLVSVFFIFLLRQSFKQIPNELYLAAKIDGKSDLRYLWRVMIPLAKPTIITMIILRVMGAWNSYLWPNLVTIRHDHLRLITVGLRHAFVVDGMVRINMQMAATAVVTVPLLLVFIFCRKYIMRGVSRSGIKG